jgi:hypothetical protein
MADQQTPSADTTLGQTSGPTYGGEIGPSGFQQDMWAHDPIAGTFPPQERSADPGSFTGGMGGGGIGGQAEPMEPGGVSQPGAPNSVYERRGY